MPGALPIHLGDAERVRGYRRYALGTRLLFGTAEYRMPLVRDLRTELLGLLSLGSTSLALFTDAALVWSGDFDQRIERVGVGAELKNGSAWEAFPSPTPSASPSRPTGSATGTTTRCTTASTRPSRSDANL